MRRNQLPHFYGFGSGPQPIPTGGNGDFPPFWPRPPAPTQPRLKLQAVQAGQTAIYNPPKLPPLELPPSDPGKGAGDTGIGPRLVRCPPPNEVMWVADTALCPTTAVTIPVLPVTQLPPVHQLPPGPSSIDPIVQTQNPAPGTTVTTTTMPAAYWAQFRAFSMAKKLMIGALFVSALGIGAALYARRKHA